MDLMSLVVTLSKYMPAPFSLTIRVILVSLLCFPLEFAIAQPDPSTELRRQQEREKQLLEQNSSQPDVRLQATLNDSFNQRLPEQESPCFQIDKLTLQALDTEGKVLLQHPFLWAARAANYIDVNTVDTDTNTNVNVQILDTPIGRCLGSVGVNTVMKRVQNAIIAEGYITTSVLAAPQDLTKGELVLTVIPGRIREVRFSDSLIDDASTDTSPTALWNALPSRYDQRLYLRDIEQGLENLKRVPTAEADIQIVPSNAPDARPGDSDLVVVWAQGRPFRWNLSLDNSGSESTGKNQGAFTFSYDNPLGLNDLFYLSVNNDLGGGISGPRGTRGNTLHYSIPFGYNLLSLTASNNNYHQTIVGATQNFVYRGESDNINFTVSRYIYRDAKHKTRWSLGWWRRSSKNYINDTEVEVQRRRMAGWEMGLHHKAYVDRATFDAELRYRRGTGAFGSLAAPEENFNEGTSQPAIVDVDLGVNAPFNLWGQSFTYRGQVNTQWNHTPLVPQDRFSIGSRYSVRGFNGERTLAGDRGWTISNDLSLQLGHSSHAVYLGIDYGEVNGQSAANLIAKHLSGSALGIKGSISSLSYDISVAAPINEPDGFSDDSYVVNATINWGF
ncbi:MAG: hemolysin activation/secretion protein [Candidatus Endobugula sp.]|jgi:hemolysin activation/secretion protein